jgi:enoyl-CoA hydratase/carnithine racemase
MLAQGPSVAIEMAKKLIYEGLDSSLDHALKDVEFANAICYTTEDAIEGPKALTEKRPPKFKGR